MTESEATEVPESIEEVVAAEETEEATTEE